MEVALSLRNFSYYASSETIYIHGTVFKKVELEQTKKIDRLFVDVTTNSKIGFQVSEFDQELINLLLTERILKVRSTEILRPIDSRYTATFVAESVQKCGI